MAEQMAPIADAETIRETARKVLQDSDYKMESTETFGRVIEWLLDLLKPVELFFDALYDFSPFLFFLLVAVLLVIVAALVVHIFYSFRAAMQRRARASLYSELDEAIVTRPETWEQRAQQAFEAQEYLHAIRFILHATLLRLEKSRKSNLRRCATNREYLRRFHKTAAFEPLSRMVEITDSRWFGGADCTRTDVEECFQAHQQIQAMISAGGTDAKRP